MQYFEIQNVILPLVAIDSFFPYHLTQNPKRIIQTVVYDGSDTL